MQLLNNSLFLNNCTNLTNVTNFTDTGDHEDTWVDALIRVTLIVIIVIGIFGNLICIARFSTVSSLRRKSCALFVIAIGVCDLVINGGPLLLLAVVGYLPFAVNQYACPISSYLFYVCVMADSIFICLISCERFTIVFATQYHSILFTSRKVKMIILVATLFVVVIYSPYLWIHAYVEMDGMPQCRFRVSKEIWSVLNLVETVMSFFLPFSVIFIVNGAIVIRVVYMYVTTRRTSQSALLETDQLMDCGSGMPARLPSVASFTSNGIGQNVRVSLTESSTGGSVHRAHGCVGWYHVSKTTRCLVTVCLTYSLLNFPSYISRLGAVTRQTADVADWELLLNRLATLSYFSQFCVNIFVYPMFYPAFRPKRFCSGRRQRRNRR